MVFVKDIFIYPLKSARGIALRHADIEARGLRFDRRWMVVNAAGHFVSQRTHPVLALVDVAIDGMRLRLSAAGHGDVLLPLYPASEKRRTVVVWEDTVCAVETSHEADEWVSGLLGESCAVVFFPTDAHRSVDRRYAHNNEQTAFSDGYPILMTAQASLDDLNSRLGEPVPMDRFRANIVVEGCDPFAEDTWQSVTIGHAVLPIVKPCARCVITTIDQRTAQHGAEPLASLSGYRKINNNVLFGQNMLVATPGAIAVGDRVIYSTSIPPTAP